MSNEKEQFLRKYFFKKAKKDVNVEIDSEVKENEEDDELFDVDEFIKSVESGENFDEEKNNSKTLDFDGLNLAVPEELNFEEKTEFLSCQLINLYKFAEKHSLDFSRLDWYSFVTKTAQAVKAFCCHKMGIDPEIIELKYFCSNTLYKNAIQKNEDEFFDETNVEDGSRAFAQRQYDQDGKVHYSLNINIETPMRSYVGLFPEVFSTFFHEMWHLKEFYEEEQEQESSMEMQKNFLESVVGFVEEYKEKGYSIEEIKTELEKQGIRVNLEVSDEEAFEEEQEDSDEAEYEKDSFRSRFERCKAYNNDIYTWSADGGECRADAFAHTMLCSLMKDADAIRSVRMMFGLSGLRKKVHHTFSRVYVPVRAAYRALFNVNVPQNESACDEITGDDFVAKEIRVESIERASELNKPLMQARSYELSEFHRQYEKTDLKGMEKIHDMFAKRNFRTVKKIIEADDQMDNIQQQFEDMQEDMEGETFTL